MLRLEFLVGVVCVVSFLCFGQQNPSPSSPQSRPDIKSEAGVRGNKTSPMHEFATAIARSDLVLVPVIVKRSGHHVSGLQKEAFRIEEDDKIRAISVFEEVRPEKLSIHQPDVMVRTYSNFFPAQDEPFRAISVVIDMINTPFLRQVGAKEQLIKFLLRNASADEPIAIFGLNGRGLHQLHPFTTDPKILIGALKKLKLSLSSEEATQPPELLTFDPYEEQQLSDEEQLMSDFMQDLSDTMSADNQRIAIRQTLRAMSQLAHALEIIPGRKTLIWTSAGFPFTIDDPRSFGRQGDDLYTEYEEAWRALNSASIAVYPIDLSEMSLSPNSLPSANSGISSRQINNIRGVNGAKSALRLPYDKELQQQMTLRAFADATGGRACDAFQEIDKCFQEALDDSTAYYLLGYYIGADARSGWHKLKVKVVGTGLSVRYRSGYFTAKIQDSADARRQQLIAALASPVQYTGLRLTTNVTPPSPAGKLRFSTKERQRPIEFMLGVMGNSVRVDRENGNAIDLEVVTMAFDSTHRSVATATQSVVTKLSAEMLERTEQTGLGIPEKLALIPGKYEVKFAVRDNLTGRIGTIAMPIELK